MGRPTQSALCSNRRRAASAVSAIGQIAEIIGQINDISASIAGAVEEQTATTNEIARSVSEAAKESVEISENIHAVAGAASRTTQGASNTQAAAGEMARMAVELQNLLANFKFDDAAVTSIARPPAQKPKSIRSKVLPLSA
jgi:methyl-accepting chemotaxis protein